MVVALVIALVVCGWVASRPATVALGGVTYVIAVPAPHLCFQRGPAQARCYVVGDRELGSYLSERAAADGWHYEGQLGSGHMLSNEQHNLSVSRRQVGGRVLVELTIRLHHRTKAP